MPAPLEVDVTGWLIHNLSPLLAGVSVRSELPDNLESVGPVVQPVRIGGPDDGYLLDEPTLVINCFAADAPSVNALAYRVAAAVRSLRSQVLDGAVVSYCRKLSGPLFTYPTNPKVRQAILTYQLGIYATP